MEKTIELGKIDYENTGKKNCRVTISIRFDGETFAATGAIWDARGRDWISGGQNLEEIAKYFPDNKTAQKIIAIWRDWHLNDMTAGSPAQERFLRDNPVSYEYPQSHYDAACEALAQAGLNPDPNYIHNGKPYSYGTAWLKRGIPADVAAEINSILGAL